ncbi:8-amino-7-oxononanoate synthase [Solimonas terrae]|uniref:8-amino-7-oxononanoate synthase n=1 Tax=Solimonas terrae TaxID=1396819 RepID=A0A6M2BSS7_9GAMM|nr:8-amino-7-oxononanoate synthase [Solimonas terrae]NGY05069.1 8-amino-7-oxononanoate synthase [Solimonas terrae]
MADDARVASVPLAAHLAAELRRIREADLYRTRRVIDGGHGAQIQVNGRSCLNFCSNDYLGLAADPRLAEAARAALAQGTGSGASALISGYNREHQRLEEALADFIGTPRVLLFSTGWAANLGVLRGLLGRDDALVADELNHASLIDGGRLSGARYLRVPHADVTAFDAALQETAAARLRLLVSDAIFSMDGDLAPLPELAAVAARHGAALMIDDAHGFGVLGAGGRGTPEALGMRPDIQVGTLGKAAGAAGAFVAGDTDLIEYLVQRARSFVFSTAQPPAVAAAARRGLELIREEPERRARLFDNIRRFRDGAAALGIALVDSQTPIQPLLLGDAARALSLSQQLFEQGFWVAAIRPPTVPRGTSRLRITLSATHQPGQIDALLDALAAGMRANP